MGSIRAKDKGERLRYKMVNANNSCPKTALLLNIGNTNTETALLKDDVVSSFPSFCTEDLNQQSPENLPEPLTSNLSIPWVVSSVVPAINNFLNSIQPKGNLMFITPDMADDIDFSQVDKATLGSDRVANLAAAVELKIAPAIILDCGTAITAEIIDSENRFLGGAILPGRKMMRQSLADSTGQLPYVNNYPSAPPPSGKDTAESIVFGIDTGLIGALKHILQTISYSYPQDSAFTKTVTGGDRNYFADHIDELEKAPPDFTMQGLAHITRRLL